MNSCGGGKLENSEAMHEDGHLFGRGRGKYKAWKKINLERYVRARA